MPRTTPPRIARSLFVATAFVGLGVAWFSLQDLTVAGPQSLGTTHTSHTTTGMRAELAAALDRAIDAAAADGYSLTITSGYRTPERQQELLDEAIAKYGDRETALRWVFTPERSMHVHGLAADVGDGQAAEWLEEHGARFGLCRTLEWEWWHFEWRAEWAERQSCPRPVTDPADAPDADAG